MSFNPASSIIIPAKTAYRGTTHFTRGDILVEPVRTIDKHRLNTGPEVSLVKELGYKVTVPVLGQFADLLPLYSQYQSLRFGKAIAPHTRLVEGANTTTNVYTITAHGLTTGDAVYVTWDETGPVSTPQLAKGTVVYARAVTADTITLHDTSAHATANSDVNDLTTAAVGNMYVCRQFPLTVHRASGVLLTFLNAAPIELPQLVLAGGMLMWEGNLVFQCFPAIGSVPSDGQAAFFTESASAFTPATWDTSDALTAASVTLAWGGSAPWDDFRCEEGLKVNFSPKLTGLHDGVWPLATMHMDGFDVTAEGIPWGITPAEFHALFDTDLGSQLSGEDLVIGATGMSLTLKEACIDESAALRHGAATRVVGPVKWRAQDTTLLVPGFEIAAA